MKVICKIRAFYNGEIIKPGQIIEIKSKEIPCWAKPISGKIAEEKTKQPAKLPEQTNDNVPEVNLDKTPENNSTKEQVNPQVIQELAGKSESELNAILEDLRTQALEKNITVDADNKTVIEQINELQIKLNEVNK